MVGKNVTCSSKYFGLLLGMISVIFSFLAAQCSMQYLVQWPGTEPVPPVVEVVEI